MPSSTNAARSGYEPDHMDFILMKPLAAAALHNPDAMTEPVQTVRLAVTPELRRALQAALHDADSSEERGEITNALIDLQQLGAKHLMVNKLAPRPAHLCMPRWQASAVITVEPNLPPGVIERYQRDQMRYRSMEDRVSAYEPLRCRGRVVSSKDIRVETSDGTLGMALRELAYIIRMYTVTKNF